MEKENSGGRIIMENDARVEETTPLEGEFVLKKQLKPPPPQEEERTQQAPPHPLYSEPHKIPPYKVRHSLTPFTALCEHPDRIVFQHQESNEEIILLIRKHFITNVPWIALTLFLLLLPPILLPHLSIILPFLNVSALTKTAATLFYYLVLSGFTLIEFSLWYFHLAFVTNKRIIDVDITGILFRHIAETKLDLVQDVSYSQYGLIRSLFNYGDIFIQTAGEAPNFEFDKAPQPGKIIQLVGDLVGKARQ